MRPREQPERRVPWLEALELDARPDVRIAELAAGQWGVVDLKDLRSCGLSDGAVSFRARNGRLHRLHQGVYAVGHARPPLEGVFLAAVKACGAGAVLSHFAAAALLGIIDWVDRLPEVTVHGPGTRLHPGIRVHRSSMLEPPDVARRLGIPTTSPARTLLDLAAVLDQRALRRAVRQALSLRLVSATQLAETLSRLGARRGSRKLARVVAAGLQPTRSELEDVVLDLLLTGGIAPPDVNVPMVVAGRRLIPDFRWARQRLVVEADSAAWHENKVAREDDAERQALLEAYGERVLRVSWQQAVARRAETLARVRAAGAPHA